MNTIMKMDRSGIGYVASVEKKKAQAQQQQSKPKPKPKRLKGRDGGLEGGE